MHMEINFDPQAALNFFLAFCVAFPFCMLLAMFIFGKNESEYEHNHFDHCAGCQAEYQAQQERHHARRQPRWHSNQRPHARTVARHRQ